MSDPTLNYASHGKTETLPIVRSQVKDILTQSQAFRSLSEPQRRDLASDMVKIAHFIVGDSEANAPRAAALAGAGVSARGPIQKQQPGELAGQTAGQRFADPGAVSAREGAAAYSDLVKKVDFPSFVGGLIHGVFDAIVNASIRQMEAYAELVKNVAKSVDQYMKDNVTDNQARDYLADKYPNFSSRYHGQQPALKPAKPTSNLPTFELGLSTWSTPDEDNVEQVLVSRRVDALRWTASNCLPRWS
jgi:hypothetical protein